MTSEERAAIRKRLGRLAWLLDEAIPLPGLGVRIGLDPLMGLFPGIGDAAGALFSSYLFSEAARLGAPKSLLLKMAFNVLLDTAAGAFPLLGDLFDLVWKANLRNLQLLDAYLDHPRRTAAASRLFVWSLALLLLAAVAGVGLLAFLLLRFLWTGLQGL